MAESGRSERFWKINLEQFVEALRSSPPEKNKKEKDKKRKKETEEQEKEKNNDKKVKKEKEDDLKQLNVLSYILDNVHQKDNTFVLTYDEVADRTGVSKDTVVRIMKRLGKNDFIRKLHNGAYIVHPYKLVWGPEDRRRDIWDIYRDAKKIGVKRSERKQKSTDSQSSGKEAEKEPESADSQSSGKEAEKEPESTDSQSSDDNALEKSDISS